MCVIEKAFYLNTKSHLVNNEIIIQWLVNYDIIKNYEYDLLGFTCLSNIVAKRIPPCIEIEETFKKWQQFYATFKAVIYF